MDLPITALFVGLSGLWLLRLSIALLRSRRRSTEYGMSNQIDRLVKIQSNFSEYVPLLLLMMALLEWRGLHGWLLYLIGFSFLLGRYFHFQGVLSTDRKQLTLASVLTFWPLLLASLFLVYVWLIETL